MTWTKPRTTILAGTGSMAIRQQRSRGAGAMSTTCPDSLRVRVRTRTAGFSFIELMVTLSIGGIVVAIGAPSFSQAIADIHTRSKAQQLAGALRIARISAVTRNRPAAFVLADATPASGATATVHGSRWLVEFLSSTPTPAAVEGTDLILATTAASQERVILAGPKQVCFDALGLQMPPPDTSSACVQPGGDAGGVTSYLVWRTGAPRQYQVRVHRTGRVDVCDTATTHGKDVDGCP